MDVPLGAAGCRVISGRSESISAAEPDAFDAALLTAPLELMMISWTWQEATQLMVPRKWLPAEAAPRSAASQAPNTPPPAPMSLAHIIISWNHLPANSRRPRRQRRPGREKHVHVGLMCTRACSRRSLGKNQPATNGGGYLSRVRRDEAGSLIRTGSSWF